MSEAMWLMTGIVAWMFVAFGVSVAFGALGSAGSRIGCGWCGAPLDPELPECPACGRRKRAASLPGQLAGPHRVV